VVRELSEFEIVLRGDTPGGDRWMNAIAAPVPPILIAVGDSVADALGWLPFQAIIPWESFIVVIDRSQFQRDPVGALITTVSQMSSAEQAHRQHLMQKHHADVDWAAHNTRMPTNFVSSAATAACGGY